MDLQQEHTDAQSAGSLLKQKNLTLSVAESCTGGALANAITDIPGSSAYFIGGYVAYHNRIKIEKLGVNAKALDTYGAVSKIVALQMAKNVADVMHTDIGIATTGIAGPQGGSAEKPVGTVWVGFWSKKKHFALKAQFTNKRLENKERAVDLALETLRRILLNIEKMPGGLKPHFAE